MTYSISVLQHTTHPTGQETAAAILTFRFKADGDLPMTFAKDLMEFSREKSKGVKSFTKKPIGEKHE